VVFVYAGGGFADVMPGGKLVMCGGMPGEK